MDIILKKARFISFFIIASITLVIVISFYFMTMNNIDQDRLVKMTNIYGRGESVIKVLDRHVHNSIEDVYWALRVYENKWVDTPDDEFVVWVSKNTVNTFYASKIIINSVSGVSYRYEDNKITKQKSDNNFNQSSIIVGTNLVMENSNDGLEIIFKYTIKGKGVINIHVPQNYLVDIFSNLRHHWEILIIDVTNNIYSDLVNEIDKSISSFDKNKILNDYKCNTKLLIKNENDDFSFLGNCYKSVYYNLYYVVLYDYTYEMSGFVDRSKKTLSSFSLFVFMILLIGIALLIVSDKQIRVYVELKQMKDEFEELSSIDELTSVTNRRAVMKRLVQEMTRMSRHGRPLSIMSFDIDFFKKINDTYGHNVGDIVLKNLVIEVQKCLRQTDLLGRMGGEEFLILLGDTKLDGATILAERIRETIQNIQIVKDINITISVGVGEFKKGEITSQLLARVDLALYRAKNEGRNKVCISI
jgi:diguanylate cyclase (GGDEF)-like protein